MKHSVIYPVPFVSESYTCARNITLYSRERIHHVIKEGLIFGRWWGMIYCSNVKAATTPEQSVERDHDPQSLWVRGVRELIALQN